jgi:hypothetical protein
MVLEGLDAKPIKVAPSYKAIVNRDRVVAVFKYRKRIPPLKNLKQR